MPTKNAAPHIGQANQLERVEEIRAEVIFPNHLTQKIINALKEVHPYEEVAYYLSSLENENKEVGAGMIGELEKGVEPFEFLNSLKKQMNVKVVSPHSTGKTRSKKNCGMRRCGKFSSTNSHSPRRRCLRFVRF